MMHVGIKGAAKLGKISLERPKSEQVKSLPAGSNSGKKKTSGMFKYLRMVPFRDY